MLLYSLNKLHTESHFISKIKVKSVNDVICIGHNFKYGSKSINYFFNYKYFYVFIDKNSRLILFCL